MAKRKKTGRKSKRSSSHEALSTSALKLVDRAAELLKGGILVGTKQGTKSRLLFKKKASALLTTATKHLNQAIQEGSASLRKGLRKL